MTSVNQLQFSAGDVAKAAAISMSTLQNWLKRGVVVGHRGIEGGGVQGRHRRFSWSNVIEIATAATLVKHGVSDLSIAFRVAQRFAHSGPGEIQGLQPTRIPAMPFEVAYGRTLLFVSDGAATIVVWKPGDDVYSTVRYHLRQPEAFIAVDLLSLFNRVCASLNLHPQTVMDEAYGEVGT